MIKVWANDFHHIIDPELPDPYDAEVVQRAFDAALERLAALEDRGFEGVFFAEHHFAAALNPNPNLMIAALSRITRKLRLGVMGNVLGFHQPWRLAEDLAMLDYLTQGRLEIGFASGIPAEFSLIGIPREEIRPRYAEAMEILEMAAANEVVSYHGDFYDYDDLPLMPRPLNPPRRRKWMAIYTPESAEVAARREYKVCTAYQSIEGAARAFDAYRQAAEDAGLGVTPDDIGLRRTIMIWDTDEQAAERHEELLEKAIERVEAYFAPIHTRVSRNGSATTIDPLARQTGIRDVETRGSSNGGGLNFREMHDEFIYGSPETVAEQIIDQCRRTGAGNILAVHQDAVTHEELDGVYDRWEGVISILSKASVAA